MSGRDTRWQSRGAPHSDVTHPGGAGVGCWFRGPAPHHLRISRPRPSAGCRGR
ncbi:hypothetical protein [Ornithinimicrobium kibberense]|uniref:hypothetical protein n=1 Tax=Ornithinimicrobium kibberense TaxID=282060 RepID=UPI0036196753